MVLIPRPSLGSPHRNPRSPASPRAGLRLRWIAKSGRSFAINHALGRRSWPQLFFVALLAFLVDLLAFAVDLTSPLEATFFLVVSVLSTAATGASTLSA